MEISSITIPGPCNYKTLWSYIHMCCSNGDNLPSLQHHPQDNISHECTLNKMVYSDIVRKRFIDPIPAPQRMVLLANDEFLPPFKHSSSVNCSAGNSCCGVRSGKKLDFL